MTPEEFRQYGHQAVDWIADYLARPERYPVLARVKPGELTDALPAARPRARRAHGGHPGRFRAPDRARHHALEPPRLHGLFRQLRSDAQGILGEMLAAALNPNGMLWKTSPAVTELEQVALRWLRQWTGLPEDWFGMIYDTASIGSMHAIAAARQAADPESRARGAHARAWWSTPPSRRIPPSKRAPSRWASGQETCARFPWTPNSACAPDALERR